MTSDLREEFDHVGSVFDLGEYEVEAYLTVLERGEMTASAIATETDIPQPRVYDTVRDLADTGLVEIRESRPITVLPVDPEEAFGEVRGSLENLVDGLEARYTTPTRSQEAVSLVKSRSTILRYLGEIIESAESELVLSVSPDLLARFEAELADRREAGVSVDLLLSPARDVPGPDEYDYGSVASHTRVRRGVTTPVVAVADGTYSLYTTGQALRNDQDRYGVIFNRSELGFLVSGFLNTVVWTSATTLARASDERGWPRRYATIRRCVSDLEAAAGEFHATVRGRDVETGADRTVSGRVVDVSVGTNRETAAMTVEADGERVDVGGQVAALEAVEAHEIAVGREEPPSLSPRSSPSP